MAINARIEVFITVMNVSVRAKGEKEVYYEN